MSPSKYRRVDLLTLPVLREIVRSRGIQTLLQGIVVALYFFLVFAGIYGTQIPRLNIATVGVWTVWWTGIIFLILFLGKAWCYLCPWNAVVTWVKRAGVPDLNLHWPSRLRNLYPATVFLGVISWLELGAGVTYSPRYTAYLMIALFVVAILLGLAYRKRVFCQYLCFIGAIQGVYSSVSPMELRSRRRETCRACRTKDCIRGGERGDGCPVILYPGGMDRNITSITCMECMRTCPYDNMSVFVRPFASELVNIRRPKQDEAVFIAVLLGLTLFHGFIMLQSWTSFSRGLERAAYYGLFTLLLVISAVLPLAALRAFSALTRRISSLKLDSKSVFKTLAYALVPIALFYHLAHNAMHILMEGSAVLPALSDPLGVGWDLLGTRGAEAGPLLHMGAVRTLQVAMLLAGLSISVYASYNFAKQLGEGEVGDKFRMKFLLMLILILGLTCVSLWLIYQPMSMRLMLTAPS